MAQNRCNIRHFPINATDIFDLTGSIALIEIYLARIDFISMIDSGLIVIISEFQDFSIFLIVSE